MELQHSNLAKCMRPITLKQSGNVVPCGRCPACISTRTSNWSFRLLQEEKVATSAHFLTLTYDTKFIPILDSGLLSLRKADLQLFFKRLRKAQCGNGTSPIKYYAVGEYGGKTYRPHYHCILFNAKLELIQDAWRMGHIYYGQVSGASVGYTLKYMCKQKKNFRLSPNDKRVPEFAVMSKGLGISYLSETMANWHAGDLVGRNYCTLVGGQKIAMPRYYKERLYFELERAAIRDAMAIIAHDEHTKKLDKWTAKQFANEQKAIDAAFDKMYLSSLKTTI